MKKLNIRYHVIEYGVLCECSTAIKATDEIATDALNRGVDGVILLRDTLKHLAALQGQRYDGALFLGASDVEEVEA